MEGKGDKVTVDALREMKTPLIIVAPDPMYDSSSNGYIAGIIDLILVKLRNYGHYIQPAGNAYDSRHQAFGDTLQCSFCAARDGYNVYQHARRVGRGIRGSP